MGVFAQQEWLFRCGAEIRLYLMGFGVHPAFKVRGTVKASILEHSFILNSTAGISFAEILRHIVDRLSAEGLVAAGPDHHTGMILVALEHGCGAIHTGWIPCGLIIWDGSCCVHIPYFLPGAVAFQVCFINDIETVGITEVVKLTTIGIVGRAHRVDVMALHTENVQQ